MRKREVFERVGKFDISMVRGGQDQDFTRRAKESGYEMWYTPRAIAYHQVPEYRVEKSYFKWASQRHGQSFAYMDKKSRGRLWMILFGIARCGQALFVTLPKLFMARLRSDYGALLWRRALLWRTEGYLRMMLFLFAPWFFTQKTYFQKLEFRKERNEFKK